MDCEHSSHRPGLTLALALTPIVRINFEPLDWSRDWRQSRYSLTASRSPNTFLKSPSIK